MTAERRWTHAWITGASSGIGAQLASTLADAGVRCSVSARSADKLQEVADRSTLIDTFPLDVTDVEAVEDRLDDIERSSGPVDLAILNAGLWLPSSSRDLGVEAFQKSMDVNFVGVTAALVPLVSRMRSRGGGQIVVVASVAGYLGLPRGTYYGPTKAALINMCESLQPELKQDGIKLQIVSPGFVRTPMTSANTFPMPFLVDVDAAVQTIVAGMKTGKFEIAFPWQLVFVLKLARLLPYRVLLKLIEKVVLRNKRT